MTGSKVTLYNHLPGLCKVRNMRLLISNYPMFDVIRALERMGGATRSLGLVPRVMQRELGRERSKAGKFENGGSN